MLSGVELTINFEQLRGCRSLRLVGASRRFLSCSTTVKWKPGRDLVISRAVNETSRLPSFEVLRSWKLITLSYQHSLIQYVGQLTQSLDKLFPLVPIPPSQMSTLSIVLALLDPLGNGRPADNHPEHDRGMPV